MASRHDPTQVEVVVTIGQLRALSQAQLGADFPVIEAVEAAVARWSAPPPSVHTSRGMLPTHLRPVIMGILNVTPDSFSDGGVHLGSDGDTRDAIDAGLVMVEQGADLIDVGGESTRPGAAPVPLDEELRRVVPVVRGLAARGAWVSVDTTKAAVAREAVDAGAVMVNDVSAGAFDPELIPTVAALGVPYVLMHLRGTPRTMQRAPRYDDVTAEVFAFLAERLAFLESAGIDRAQVVVDPGIGFGKTVAHNLTLLQRLRELTSLGSAVLVGASRKSFLGVLTGVEDARDRVEASLAVAALAVGAGASILRVHDVAETSRALRVAHAVHRADADAVAAADTVAAVDAVTSPDPADGGGPPAPRPACR